MEYPVDDPDNSDGSDDDTVSSRSSDATRSSGDLEDRLMYNNVYDEDDDNETQDDTHNNWVDNDDMGIYITHGKVDYFLLARASLEFPVVLKTIQTLSGNENPDQFDLFSLFFQSSIINLLLKWVEDYSTSNQDFRVTHIDILAFLRIQLLAQFYRTSATQLFKPSQKNAYSRVGNYISAAKYFHIMSAINNGKKRIVHVDEMDEIPHVRWTSPIFRNNEMIAIFNAFGQNCAMVAFKKTLQ